MIDLGSQKLDGLIKFIDQGRVKKRSAKAKLGVIGLDFSG